MHVQRNHNACTRIVRKIAATLDSTLCVSLSGNLSMTEVAVSEQIRCKLLTNMFAQGLQRPMQLLANTGHVLLGEGHWLLSYQVPCILNHKNTAVY